MNYTRSAVLIFFLSSILSANVIAQTMDLTAAYQAALERDPVIAAAQYQAKAGEEKSVQGKAGLLPQFNVGGSINYNYSKSESASNSPFSFNNSGKGDGYNLNAQFTQPVFRASNWKSYQQSKLAATQAQIQLDIARQDLILRVSQAYFNVLSAEENVAVSEAQTRAFSESLERAKLTFKVGTTTKTDKLEAQARYDNAVASEIAAKNELAIARQALAAIIGEVPTSLKKPAADIKLVDLKPTDINYWVDAAQHDNLNLKLAKLGFDVSMLEVNRLKADRLPTVDFVATASRNRSYSIFTDSDTTSTNLGVALQLAMPIYTGGLMTSRIREAESLRLQQKQLQINTERQVKLQTQQAYLNALNGKQRVDALRQAMLSNQSALEATKKGLEVGVRTNLDVLDAQQRLYATERDYTVAKYNYLINVLQLKAAVGDLTEKDVTALNQLLTSG